MVVTLTSLTPIVLMVVGIPGHMFEYISVPNLHTLKMFFKVWLFIPSSHHPHGKQGASKPSSAGDVAAAAQATFHALAQARDFSPWMDGWMDRWWMGCFTIKWVVKTSNNYVFMFTPKIGVSWSNLTIHIFSDGVGEKPPTSVKTLDSLKVFFF